MSIQYGYCYTIYVGIQSVCYNLSVAYKASETQWVHTCEVWEAKMTTSDSSIMSKKQDLKQKCILL
jgi:hypothetical protein